jgi:hypothetical protein
VLGALGVDTTSYTAAFALLQDDRYPFAHVPRRTAGFAGIASLLSTMTGEGEADPPVHAVFVPGE